MPMLVVVENGVLNPLMYLFLRIQYQPGLIESNGRLLGHAPNQGCVLCYYVS